MVGQPMRQELKKVPRRITIAGRTTMKLCDLVQEAGMVRPVLVHMAGIKVYRLHHGFLLGEVVSRVVREFGKYRFQIRGRRGVLTHGQTAKAVDQINQATVLFIDVVQSGDEGGIPLKGFHSVLPSILQTY